MSSESAPRTPEMFSEDEQALLARLEAGSLTFEEVTREGLDFPARSLLRQGYVVLEDDAPEMITLSEKGKEFLKAA